MPLAPQKQIQYLSITVGVLFLLCIWFGWRYSTYKAQTESARDQIAYFSEMSNRSMAGQPAQAAECLQNVAAYYPSGTKQTCGSALDDLVEAQRKRAQLEIISVLRARTRDDLGQEPGPWIKKYRKDWQPPAKQTSPRAAATFQTIVAQASAPMSASKFQSLVPNTMSAVELYDLVRLLKEQELGGVEKYGDQGTTVLENNQFQALYQLSQQPDGASYLIQLLQDENLIWDGAGSLTMCDAILNCGPKALPYLKKPGPNSQLAQRCISMIQSGQKTAF